MSRTQTLALSGLIAAGLLFAALWRWHQRPTNGRDALRAVPDVVYASRADGGDGTKLVDVELVNDGSATVDIVDVHTSWSCPCTIAEPLAKKSLVPGDRTTLRLRLTPPRFGAESQTVFVRTNSATRPLMMIPVRLQGLEIDPPTITQRPNDVQLVGHSLGQVVSRSIALTAIERANQEPWIAGLDSASGNTEALQDSFPEERPLGSGLVLRQYSFLLITKVATSAGTVDRLRIVARREGAEEVRDIVVVTHFRPQLRLVPEEIVIRVSDDTLFPIRYPVMLVSESDDAWGFELASELPSWLVLVPGAEESTLDRRLMIHVERACLQDDDLRNKGAAEVELGFTTSVPGCERIAAVIRLYRNQ